MIGNIVTLGLGAPNHYLITLGYNQSGVAPPPPPDVISTSTLGIVYGVGNTKAFAGYPGDDEVSRDYVKQRRMKEDDMVIEMIKQFMRTIN